MGNTPCIPRPVLALLQSLYLSPHHRRHWDDRFKAVTPKGALAYALLHGLVRPPVMVLVDADGECVQESYAFVELTSEGARAVQLAAAERALQRAEPDSGRTAAPAPCAGWQRLTIVIQNGGNDLAQLNGTDYRLTGKQTQFLQALQNACGGMVLGTTLATNCGDRADRIFTSLSPELRAIIDRPGKGRQGYRMV